MGLSLKALSSNLFTKNIIGEDRLRDDIGHFDLVKFVYFFDNGPEYHLIIQNLQALGVTTLSNIFFYPIFQRGIIALGCYSVIT